jgi:hypothetical protein
VLKERIKSLSDNILDGTSTSTIGGLSRATYPTLNATVTASGGTLSLAKMSTLYNAVTFGPNKPTIGLTTQAIFSLYESLLLPMQRINTPVGMTKGAPIRRGASMNEGMMAQSGFTGLDYKGFPILPDQKCTSGVLFFLNEESMDFYAVKKYPDAENVKLRTSVMEGEPYENGVEGLGFKWTGWVKVANQEVIIGRVIFAGNFVPYNPRFNGKLTGISSV